MTPPMSEEDLNNWRGGKLYRPLIKEIDRLRAENKAFSDQIFELIADQVKVSTKCVEQEALILRRNQRVAALESHSVLVHAEVEIADLTAKLEAAQKQSAHATKCLAEADDENDKLEAALQTAREALNILVAQFDTENGLGSCGAESTAMASSAAFPSRTADSAGAIIGPQAQQSYREQAISFAYGNVHMSNSNVTREMVAAEYDKLHPQAQQEGK